MLAYLELMFIEIHWFILFISRYIDNWSWLTSFNFFLPDMIALLSRFWTISCHILRDSASIILSSTHHSSSSVMSRVSKYLNCSFKINLRLSVFCKRNRTRVNGICCYQHLIIFPYSCYIDCTMPWLNDCL